MTCFNVDLNFFDHLKTRRLAAKLGAGTEVFVLRLWAYCGRFHAADGSLATYEPAEIESLIGWNAEPGALIQALLAVGFLDQTPRGLAVHGWKEFQGHIAAYQRRGKLMAKARWARAGRTPNRSARRSADAARPYSDAASNAGDGSQQCTSNAPSNAGGGSTETGSIAGSGTTSHAADAASNAIAELTELTELTELSKAKADGADVCQLSTRAGEGTSPDVGPATPSTHTPDRAESTLPLRELPNLEAVLQRAQQIGLAEWKARDWFNEMEGCGWQDYAGRPIRRWDAVLQRIAVKWRADGSPTGPPANAPNPRQRPGSSAAPVDWSKGFFGRPQPTPKP